uniref:MPN domain-containing protein n=1 Tax=Kalanchoe fedtschenkoi TaxID=63787 RepID=A0A7N0UIU2_KALFE
MPLLIGQNLSLRYIVTSFEADIFRQEKNIIDLYVMLLRFSSLNTETIPHHRDYKLYQQSQKNAFKKKLLNALEELELLKPLVQRKLDDMEIKQVTQAPLPFGRQLAPQKSRNLRPLISRPPEAQFRSLSSSSLQPKEETLSKHSLLGPNGFSLQFKPPMCSIKVQYPSNIDLAPVDVPSLQQPQPPQTTHGDQGLKRRYSGDELEGSSLETVPPPKDDQKCFSKELDSLISFEPMDATKLVRQPSPPPVLAEVQDLVPVVPPQVTGAVCGTENSPAENLVSSGASLELYISTTLMENFMRMAKRNSDKNLETCGVLAGSLKNRKFYVTSLIIPKQESTSDSCQTTNEEEIFEVQDKQSLFPLGWIHTHPSQSCFMSSIDLHTQYSYQIMLPESVAIVMAPRDSSRKYGIFRLSTPGGMSVIRGCDRRGFHPHDPPSDGGPIYKQCSDVYMDPNLRFDVVDLR